MQKDKQQAKAVGLDIGTSRIVAARRDQDSIRYSTQLNAFVDLPSSNLTATTLKKERVPHSISGERIVVHGSEAARFADLLGIELRRSMSRGVLNPEELDSLHQIQNIIEQVVGRAEYKDQRLYFSVPAVIPGFEENATYHEASLRQMLTGLGYKPQSINEGLAIVYAELEATNYSGIGISFGGGLCNVCFAYLSVPVSTFAIQKAGDYIDSSAAAAAGELTNRIRLRKEDVFYFNGVSSDKGFQALTIYYDDMIGTVVAQMKDHLRSCAKTGRFKDPVPVVLSGGSALPKGFRERFEDALSASNFPIPVSEVRLAASPLETTARGALIAALSEVE